MRSRLLRAVQTKKIKRRRHDLHIRVRFAAHWRLAGDQARPLVPRTSIKQMILRSQALATACIDPAKQCQDYRNEEQDGWHQKRKYNDQDRGADFIWLPKADKAKEPTQKKIAGNLQCYEQVKFEGTAK
jgi:hypothetical protein